MSTKLPEALATYFAGHNDHDVDAMIGTFAEGATVKDEGQERRGLPAIRRWMEESNAKYSVTVAVINIAETAANTTATGRVSGNFPGSLAELRFIFTVGQGKITRLDKSKQHHSLGYPHDLNTSSEQCEVMTGVVLTRSII
jgi:hypothetical protein